MTSRTPSFSYNKNPNIIEVYMYGFGDRSVRGEANLRDTLISVKPKKPR